MAGGCATQFRRGQHARYRFDVGLHYIGDWGRARFRAFSTRCSVRVDYVPARTRWLRHADFPTFGFAYRRAWTCIKTALYELFPCSACRLNATSAAFVRWARRCARSDFRSPEAAHAAATGRRCAASARPSAVDREQDVRCHFGEPISSCVPCCSVKTVTMDCRPAKSAR